MSRNFSERQAEDLFTIYGVFLANNGGENADNTLFRAFQQLFSGSTSTSTVQLHERQEIEDIISGGLITPVFQPIFSLGEGAVHGYEALSRVADPAPFPIRNCSLPSPLNMDSPFSWRCSAAGMR
ncbi:hypothetical protein [Geotalea toluenoxydans]|uniref:hypothetical protein n=1 Tax=Geotalea toluenoxydans TaxID=421624 RepID=UPI0006CF29DB|nr:hypothetical protein [Geotalea toluenoxydans]